MSLCTPAGVRALDISGDDFTDPPFTDPVLQAIIDCAELLIDEDCGGLGLATKAACALSAHFAFTQKNGAGAAAGGGNVTAQSDGRLSRSYASILQGDEDDWLRTTPYGQQYLMFRDAMPCGAVPLVLRC